VNTGTAYIDNIPFQFSGTETILQFVRRYAGRDIIPTLCHAENLEDYGSCRICSVEIAPNRDGLRKVVASCYTPVTDGLHIFPSSDRIIKLRKNILELVLSVFPEEKVNPEPGMLPNEFQKVVAASGIKKVRYPSMVRRDLNADASHPYIRSDFTECINCYRCVRACDELQAANVIGISGRGSQSSIIKGFDAPYAATSCVGCGACVQTCPTNAITDRFNAKTIRPDRIVRTVCTYCGVGCNIDVKVVSGQVVAVEGSKDSEVNRGHTCLKGRYAFGFYNHPDRLRSPLIRKDGKLTEATWDEAYDYTVARFREIKEKYGPDSLAGISSARCTNEENYLMQKFFRAVIGTNNIDGCARVCHAPTAMGMQWAFGTGAATNSINDIYETGCILIVGANPSDAHPVTGARIKSVVMRGVPLIVIDPIRTELARYAKHHLQNKPGTNVAILNMFAYYILEAGLENNGFIDSRTEGWDEFRKYLQFLDLDYLEAACGVDRNQVRAAAVEYASAEAAMEFHGLGVTEHWQGTKAITLLANIAMMTGNIGRKGCGINPLRGQNNVQGAADMGVQPHQGAGYLPVDDKNSIKLFSEFYGADVPGSAGYRIPEMFAAANRGDLKALWIMGEDLLQTDPNTCHVEEALGKLEFLVIQEIFMSETCRIADVVFPASSFLEKEGTFTNGERRIQRVNRAVDPLPGTKPDGQIVVDIMNRMSYSQAGYSAEVILKEISEIVPFFRGVKWDELQINGKQWPVNSNGTDTKILHTESFKRGKGKFHVWDYEESPEITANSSEYPYLLTTGRILEHYNSGTMTRRTPNAEIVHEDILLINQEDAADEIIADGDYVELSSARGKIIIKCRVSDSIGRRVLYTTFHFPETSLNTLTGNVGDQYTLTPEYKLVSAGIRKSLFGKVRMER
jgi:formate dehydrogenase major subunit